MGKKRSVLYVAGIFIAFSCIVFWNGFMRGSDFSWTVQQDGYWDAVVEMVLAYWIYLMIWCSKFRNDKKIVMSVVVFLILSFLHAFFYAVIICTLYGGMIYLTGYIINRVILKVKYSSYMDFHFCFVLGMAGLTILIGIASALKIGTAEKLRFLFIIIFCLELLFMHKDIKRWFSKLFQLEEKESLGEKENYVISVIVALIMTMITLVICRANLGLDYDSLWYGLRSNYVLAPYTGIYDNVTLMACVYTYSKGIEVLTLPFSGLSTYSFIIGVNVMFCLMTLIAVYDLGKIVCEKKYSACFVALVALTPSIMNMAITAKSDMATIYLQLTVLIYATMAIKKKSSEYFSLSFLGLILSFGYKPSSIVFSTLIMCVIIIFSILQKLKIRKGYIKVWVIPLIAVGMLWVRTWIITGYPITSLIVSFFEKLKFYPKYPYTLPTANTMSVRELFLTGAIWERLKRLYRIFFKPDAADLYTLEISWWGNIVFCFMDCFHDNYFFALEKNVGKNARKYYLCFSSSRTAYLQCC